MIRAYDEMLINTACDILGRMLDFAEHSMHIDPASMMKLFIASGAASEFERGDIRMITGVSGVELAYEVLDRSGIDYERRSQRHTAALSGEYWCAYAIARLQWKLGISFEEITSVLDVTELPQIYRERKTSLLEKLPWDASEDEKTQALKQLELDYIESTEKLFKQDSESSGRDSRLKQTRIKNGLSQSQLAKASGIPLRTIQQYEQRQKNINKARAEYLIMLSSALKCEPALLLESD